MKTIWNSSLLLIVLSLLLASCSNQTSSQPVDQGPILIGAVLNTTGIQAYLDEPGLRGAQLAVDELNKQGGILGRKVELVNIDGQSDPEIVEKAAEELVKQGAVALIAPADFDFGSPVS
jgi:branched-chain amino acid transport system substrate-binding protein